LDVVIEIGAAIAVIGALVHAPRMGVHLRSGEEELAARGSAPIGGARVLGGGF
jgi:gas vesicle protein